MFVNAAPSLTSRSASVRRTSATAAGACERRPSQTSTWNLNTNQRPTTISSALAVEPMTTSRR
jgi:hypothetical protein